MTNQTLSKSDFTLACSCAKKLIYKKANYPTTLEGNEFMELLADGGYLIGKYATLHYPGGIEISGSQQDALRLTERYLHDNENIVLFEAAILAGQKLVRVDILEKKGQVLNLIEVKAKSFDGEATDPYKGLIDYLEDVCYQRIVMREAYPEFIVNSFLFLPDKSKRLEIDQLLGWFESQTPENDVFTKFRKPEVHFIYERQGTVSDEHQLLLDNSLMTLLPVDDQLDKLEPGLKNAAVDFLRILNEGIQDTDHELSKVCFKCEYRTASGDANNGYRECFGDLADIEPSISDLYYFGTVGGSKKPLVNELIRQGKVSLFDLKPEDFYKKNTTEMGARGQRQLIQFEFTRKNMEWVSPAMNTELNSWQYPLHFVDFETYTGAMPHHKGMRPYELTAFQWSCHTIEDPDAEPVHAEWINMDHDLPNFRFAESLMNHIGLSGTPLMWATHENTSLRTILGQMDQYDYDNPELRQWLETMCKPRNGAPDEGRWVDMNAFTLKHYFHPYMKGKTSIKKVLPAIWNNNEYLHKIPWLKKYVKKDLGGVIHSPYDALSDIMADLEKEEVVKDGTAAMRAYQEMQFGATAQNLPAREKLKKQLLQYCELDTMAMVIIWKYWKEKLGQEF